MTQIERFVFSLWVVSCLCLSVRSAEESSFEIDRSILGCAEAVHLGDSARSAARKLAPAWQQVSTDAVLRRSLFHDLVPYTNANVISTWESPDKTSNGAHWTLFVVFGSSQKTNVEDVLFWNSPGTIQPMLDGTYSRNLRKIKPGDSIQTVYSLLGRKECEYVLGEDGKWRVKFVYMDHDGKFIEIQADAGTGKVVRKKDITLD